MAMPLVPPPPITDQAGQEQRQQAGNPTSVAAEAADTSPALPGPACRGNGDGGGAEGEVIREEPPREPARQIGGHDAVGDVVKHEAGDGTGDGVACEDEGAKEGKPFRDVVFGELSQDHVELVAA